MKTLDKLEYVIHVLKEMECVPDNISVSCAPDNKLLISVQYKNAHKIDRHKFNVLTLSKNIELHIPEITLTDNCSKKAKDTFNIFF